VAAAISLVEAGEGGSWQGRELAYATSHEIRPSPSFVGYGAVALEARPDRPPA
jgi:hypothetical protein